MIIEDKYLKCIMFLSREECNKAFLVIMGTVFCTSHTGFLTTSLKSTFYSDILQVHALPFHSLEEPHYIRNQRWPLSKHLFDIQEIFL